MRLIDADALIQSLQIRQEICFGCPEPEWLEELMQALDNAPTVETDKPRGTYQCFHCGSYSVIWDSDFMFDECGYDGDGVVHFCHCANCGAEIEYRIPIGGDDD